MASLLCFMLYLCVGSLTVLSVIVTLYLIEKLLKLIYLARRFVLNLCISGFVLWLIAALGKLVMHGIGWIN